MLMIRITSCQWLAGCMNEPTIGYFLRKHLYFLSPILSTNLDGTLVRLFLALIILSRPVSTIR